MDKTFHRITPITLVSLILFGWYCPQSWAQEPPNPRKVELLNPSPYNPDTSPHTLPRSLTKNIVNLGLLLSEAGGWVHLPKAIHQQIDGLFTNHEELRQYFPGDTPKTLTKGAIEELKAKGLTELTNSSAIPIVDTFTDYITGKVIDRILEKSGISSPQRRAAWSKAILDKFHACTAKASNAVEAISCSDSMSAGLSHNIGLALVYEVAHEKLGSTLSQDVESKLLTTLDRNYKSCAQTPLGKIRPRHCIVDALRIGVLEVAPNSAKVQLAEKFKPLSPLSKETKGASQRLDKATIDLKSKLSSCLSKLSALDKKTEAEIPENEEQRIIMGCIDDMVINAGTFAIHEKLIQKSPGKPAIIELFPERNREAIIAQQQSLFRNCGDQQKRNGIRYKEGSKKDIIDIDACERLVTNNIAYSVTKIKMNDSAVDTLGAGAQAQAALADGVAAMNKCWNKDNDSKQMDACLSTSISVLAHSLADRRLDQRLDADYVKSNPKTKSDAIKEFDACITKELKGPIAESSDLDSRLQTCGGITRGKVARKVAEFKLREQFKNQLTPDQVNEIVHEVVHGSFSSCLGDAPSDVRLDACTNPLVKDAALAAARIEIKTKALPQYNPDKKKAEAFSNALLARMSTCIDGAGESASSDEITARAKLCGDLLLNRTVLSIMKDQLQRALDPDCSDGAQAATTPATAAMTTLTNDSLDATQRLFRDLVDYDVHGAKQSIPAIIAEIDHELAQADSLDSRKKLVQWMIDTGILDQLIKAITLDALKTKLSGGKSGQQLSPALVAKLTDKAALDRIFATPEGKRIVQYVGKSMLTPMLMDGKTMESPEIVTAQKKVETKIEDLLIESPDFGEVLIDHSVSEKISELWYYNAARWACPGKVDWQVIKQTDTGMDAAIFIRERIVRPQVKGRSIPPQKLEALLAQAEQHIMRAAKEEAGCHAKP